MTALSGRDRWFIESGRRRGRDPPRCRHGLRGGPRAHLAGGRAVRRGARAAPAEPPGARRGQDHVHPVQPRVRRRGQAPPPARDGDRGPWVARRRVIFATFTTPRRRPQASPPSQRTRPSRSSAPRRGPSARGAASTPRGRGASRGVEEVLSSRSDGSNIGVRRGSSATRPTTTARRRRRSGPARPRRPRYVRRHFPFSRRWVS